MRLLLLAATLMMATTGFARTNNPEMVDWAEYQAMTPAHRDEYLKSVAEALGEFEAATAEVFAADTFASYPYFREMFGNVLGAVVPELSALPADRPVDCLNTSFEVKKNSPPGTFCVYANNETSCTYAAGAKGERAQSSFPRIDSIIGQCPQRFLKFPEAVDAYQKYAQLHPEMNAKNLKNIPVDNTSIAAQETPGKKGAVQEPNAGRSAESIAAGKLSKGCKGVSRADRLKARQSWRASSNPACLNGGEISSYSKGDKSACSPKDNGKCNAKNTYARDGKQKPLAAGRRTLCLNELYCQANKDPICVEANGGAFTNCQTAVDKNPATIKFGAACVGNDMSRYNAVVKNVSVICDHDLARSLLCDDCQALKAKLDLAQAKNSSGRPGGATTPAAAPNGDAGARQ